MLVDNGSVVLAYVYQDKEFGVAVGLAVELVKLGWGQQFTGKGVSVGYLAGHFPVGLTTEIYHLSFLLFYPVFNVVLVVAWAWLVIGQCKAFAKAAGVGFDLSVGAVDGCLEVAGFDGAMVQEIATVDDIVYCQCVHLFSVLGFWDRAALGGATLEGIRVWYQALSWVAGGCVLDEVGYGHCVESVVGGGGFDHDEDAAKGRRVGCGHFGGVLGV